MMMSQSHDAEPRHCVSRGFPVQRCIVLKHLSKAAEEDPGSPPAKRSCPDLQVTPRSWSKGRQLQPSAWSIPQRDHHVKRDFRLEPQEPEPSPRHLFLSLCPLFILLLSYPRLLINLSSSSSSCSSWSSCSSCTSTCFSSVLPILQEKQSGKVKKTRPVPQVFVQTSRSLDLL